MPFPFDVHAIIFSADAVGLEVRPMGSAGAKMLSVLLGDADAYLHAGGQDEWDQAAPVGVALAAGDVRLLDRLGGAGDGRPAIDTDAKMAEAILALPGFEPLDDRQREGPKMQKIPAIAFESLDSRAFRIFPRLRLDLDAVLLIQAVQPAMPALGIAANHGGLDDQRLPFPRRAQ